MIDGDSFSPLRCNHAWVRMTPTSRQECSSVDVIADERNENPLMSCAVCPVPDETTRVKRETAMNKRCAGSSHTGQQPTGGIQEEQEI